MITKKFVYDGAEYASTDRGYCYRDRKRISASEFTEALNAKDLRDRRLEALAERARTEKEEDMNVIEVGGVEYRNDWANGKYWKGDEEISRDEFDRALGINRRGTKGPRRRPRDVAFEADFVTITSRQRDFLHVMAQGSSQGSPDAGWWVDLLIEGAGLPPMSAGAMVSTLREKGLIEVSSERREDGGRGRKAKRVRLTEDGRRLWDSMGL